jgi:hypothetical protein
MKYHYKLLIHALRPREEQTGRTWAAKELYKPLFLQVLVGLAVIHVTFVVFQLLHGLLFKYLMSTFLLQLLGN